MHWSISICKVTQMPEWEAQEHEAHARAVGGSAATSTELGQRGNHNLSVSRSCAFLHLNHLSTFADCWPTFHCWVYTFWFYCIFIWPDLNILSTNLANKPSLLEKHGKSVEIEMCVSLNNSKKESSDTQQCIWEQTWIWWEFITDSNSTATVTRPGI